MSTRHLSRTPTPPPGGTSWADRYPDKSAQTTRPGKRLTDTEKGSRAVRAKLNATKSEALTADLEAFITERDDKIREIADKHAKHVDYIEKLLLHSPVFKSERALNIRNAIIHHKTMEVNAGRFFFHVYQQATTVSLDRDTGHKYTLKEIKKFIENDEDLLNLSKERTAELIEELREYRALKRKGARISNFAAGSDVRITTHNIQREVRN